MRVGQGVVDPHGARPHPGPSSSDDGAAAQPVATDAGRGEAGARTDHRGDPDVEARAHPHPLAQCADLDRRVRGPVQVEQVVHHGELVGVEVAGHQHREAVRVGGIGGGGARGRVAAEPQPTADHGRARPRVAGPTADRPLRCPPQPERLHDHDGRAEVDLQQPAERGHRATGPELGARFGERRAPGVLGPAGVEDEPDQRREPVQRLNGGTVRIEQEVAPGRAGLEVAELAVDDREVAAQERRRCGVAAVGPREPLDEVVGGELGA